MFKRMNVVSFFLSIYLLSWGQITYANEKVYKSYGEIQEVNRKKATLLTIKNHTYSISRNLRIGEAPESFKVKHLGSGVIVDFTYKISNNGKRQIKSLSLRPQ